MSELAADRGSVDSRPAPGASDTNGGVAAQATLIFLGFSLQLLQVGLIPLLPLIGKDLRITPGETSWLVTSGLLSGAICLAVLTRLADLIGKRRVVLVCLVLVLIGSILGWIADSLTMLIVSRVLMGAVLPMLALPEAIAADTIPSPRSQVTIGAIHAGTGVGIAGGLLLGALAGAGEASWRIFFAAGTICSVIAIVVTVAFVRESPARSPSRLDVVGAGLLSAGLIGVLLAVGEGATWGWGSATELIVGVIGVALLVAWVLSQRWIEQPLISVERLVAPELRIPYAITFLAAFGVYGAFTAISRLAQTPASTGFGYGYSTLQIAWFAIPQAIGALLTVYVIRRLAPRGHVVTALALGTALTTLAFLLFLLFTHRPGIVFVALLIYAASTGIILAATQIVIVSAVPAADSGIALGLSVVLYAVGNATGSAVVGVFFTSFTIANTGLPSLQAYNWGFIASGLAGVLAIMLCVPLMWRRRAA